MECAAAVEAIGYDACFVTDHPAPDAKWLAAGGHHALDPMVASLFAAAATTCLRLHTHILVLAYRNPLLTAKSVLSLDVLSQGRLILGVAAGYLKPEFAALGVDFDERNELTDEAIDVLRAARRTTLRLRRAPLPFARHDLPPAPRPVAAPAHLGRWQQPQCDPARRRSRRRLGAVSQPGGRRARGADTTAHEPRRPGAPSRGHARVRPGDRPPGAGCRSRASIRSPSRTATTPATFATSWPRSPLSV